jgi:hypothetical protein
MSSSSTRAKSADAGFLFPNTLASTSSIARRPKSGFAALGLTKQADVVATRVHEVLCRYTSKVRAVSVASSTARQARGPRSLAEPGL